MGQRITQRIYTCSLCNKVPEDGEYMWFMGNQIWCEKCCDEVENYREPNNTDKQDGNNNNN